MSVAEIEQDILDPVGIEYSSFKIRITDTLTPKECYYKTAA